MQFRGATSAVAIGLTLWIGACGGNVRNGDEADGSDDGGDDGTPAVGGFGAKDPGTVAVRRLNALEYDNTVRDLLGATKGPAQDFSFSDRAAFGFDNNANALDIDLTNLESYAKAAEGLVKDVMGSADRKKRLVACDLAAQGESCARTSLSAFASRAFRRPVTDGELDNLMKLVKVARDQGDSFEVGVGLALEAILNSPNFLYRVEVDPDPTSTKARALDSYEMASRLSYFLWSSMPDETLFDAAKEGRLQDSEDVAAQVERMLKDPKAEALVKSFGALWIPNRVFIDHEVDKDKFPKWSPELRAAMLGETEALLGDLFAGKIGFNEFLTADYTYVNDLLAEHYGLSKPGSTALKKVQLGADSKRRGYLTHASFLAATSQPAVTSIVKRGRFVYENLMCGTVPEPQEGVPQFDTSGGGTLREKFERHRADPKCRPCHEVMDPPGFALENYDAIGGYREKDNGATIDPSGDLLVDDEVTKIDNALSMAEAIAKSDGYGTCVVRGLYTFALGRGPDAADGGGDMDEAILANLKGDLDEDSWRFPALVQKIVASSPFRARRANLGLEGAKK